MPEDITPSELDHEVVTQPDRSKTGFKSQQEIDLARVESGLEIAETEGRERDLNDQPDIDEKI